MTRSRPGTFAAVLAIGGSLLLSAPAAQAGDAPTPEQRQRIESVLRQMGFTSWGDIEREDDGRKWEIDVARGADGRKYDLELAADDLREIRRKLDE